MSPGIPSGTYMNPRRQHISMEKYPRRLARAGMHRRVNR